MAKAPPKTPAAAAEKDEKAAELPPAPAAQAEPECPYLLSLDALNHIFDSHSAPPASSSESINAIDTTAPAAATTTLKTTADKFRLLHEALGVQHFDANPRTATWVDFCFGVLCFARQEGESNTRGDADQADDEKALLLLTIANDIFQFATTTAAATMTAFSSDNNNNSEELRSTGLPSVELCYNRFRECVRQVSSVSATTVGSDTEQQPPAAATPAQAHTPTLSTHEVARFVAFMAATFFRHLPAYQFIFRHARPSVTREMELFVETPFPPPSLTAATLIEASDIE